ncbi:MAG TPA: helix-turn-helix domain-containing protein [Mycobacteriales bacterium]|nr:helix-turn-helix domain-containing protein [Mycobacteriales bacterium]
MSVGEELTRAREASGLSVEDVSASTRIRAGLIRAIEADDFEPCGGAVYARGHLRSIARVVGIDPEPLVADYDRAHAQESLPVPVPNQPAEPDLAARADRRPPNWTGAMAAALVAICVLAAYGLVHRSPSHSGNEANQGTSTVQSSSSPQPSHPSVRPSLPSSPLAQLPTTNNAIALIRVTGSTTWLQVETLSGRLLFQGLLNRGDSKVFRDAKGLRIVIGNAPAVQLVADNHDFGSPHSSGNVAHVTVQPGGEVQFA